MRTRCQNRLAGNLVIGANTPDQCDRTWSTKYTSANQVALEKCAPLECKSGFDGSGNAACYEECFTGQLGTCKQTPTGDVVAAGSSSWVAATVQSFLTADATGDSLGNFAFITLGPLCFLLLLCVLKIISCPAYLRGNVLRFYPLTGMVCVYGIVMMGVFGWIFSNWSMMGALFHDRSLVICGMTLACILVLGAAFGTYGVCYRNGILMWGYLFVSLAVLIFTILVVALAIAASSELDGLVRESLTRAGVGAQEVSSRDNLTTYEKIGQSMSSLACNSYKLCCENTALLDQLAANNASRTCATAHAGLEQDVAVVLADPSNPNFCQYLTGLNSSVSGPSEMCGWMASTSGSSFLQQQCRDQYCVEGLKGFEQFLAGFILLWTNNMRSIGLFVSFVISLQIIQLANLFYIIRLSDKEASVGPEPDAGGRKKKKKKKKEAEVFKVQVASASSHRTNRTEDDDSSGSDNIVPVVPSEGRGKRGRSAERSKKRNKNGGSAGRNKREDSVGRNR